ncbi:Non-ribosomal peptide synthetase modules [Microbacterium sp. C448]|nr:Non-ribosomal peptide synthetase modules [Microbacterium sp. C448]
MFAVVLGAVLVLVVAGAAWVGIRAWLAQSHLNEAQQSAAELPNLVSTDPAAAATAVDALSEDTSAARELTSDVIWRTAESLPWIGPQLHAVSVLARSIDDVASDALGPLIDVAGTIDLDSFAPRDGAIDLSPFIEMQDAAAVAADGTRQAAASLAAVDRTALVGAVRSPFDEASSLLDGVAVATESLANASVLLPRMLGADGPRDYLVIVQNNAEWRSLGGNPGAMVLIHTENGAMTLTEQDTASGVGSSSDPILPIDDELMSITGASPGMWFQNVTQATDFATAAQLANEFWARKYGTPVDGVISIDPIALSYLLSATGPVTLQTGDVLDEANAAQLLLNEVYLRYADNEQHDAFFAGSAAAVFDSVSSGAAQPGPLLEALARAGEEHHLLIWSAHSDDQAVLDGTTLQGGLPVTDASATRFGVYVNDGTGSKMDYYARLNTTVGWCGALADGRDAAALRVTIKNDAPVDAETSLSPYIHGDGIFGVPPGTARTVAYIYLPKGAMVVSSHASGSRTIDTATHAGRDVISWSVDLPPGGSASFDVVVATAATPILDVVRTPTLYANETEDISISCEFA